MRAYHLVFAIVLAGCGSDDSGGQTTPVDGGRPGDAPVDRYEAASEAENPDRPDTGDVVPGDEGADGSDVSVDGDGGKPPIESGADAEAGRDAAEGGSDVVCAGGTVDCDSDGTCDDLDSNPSHCGRCDHSCLGGACLGALCQPFPVATALQSPIGLAVVGTDVYATDFGNPPKADGALVRIAADGSVSTLETGLSSPGGLWFDATSQSLLMTDYFGFAVISRPIMGDAGSATTIISNRLGFPLGIASNASSFFIVNFGDVPGDGTQTIQRRPRSDLTTYAAFSAFPGGPTHLDLDANYLYWMEADAGRIMRRPVGADPDAGSVPNEVIASGPMTVAARGIAVDGATIYFSRYGTPLIDGGPIFGIVLRVANVPGSTPVELATIPGRVEDVAVDAKAIYVAGRESGTVWKVAK
jgi:hypothetical protein